MTKTFEEQLAADLASKKETKAADDRTGQRAVQEHLAKQRTDAQQSFQLMEAAINQAKPVLAREGVTVELQLTTIHADGATERGHLFKVRGPGLQTHDIDLNYWRPGLAIDNRHTGLSPIVVSAEEAQQLVREILRALGLV